MSRLAMRWMVVGEWRARPARVISAAVAIAIGVALGFAVHTINASAFDEFSRAIRTVNGDADLQAHAVTPRGFGEALYPRLAHVPGVAAVSPALEMTATLGGDANASLTLIGLDPLRAAAVTPSLIGRPQIAASRGDDSTMGSDDVLNQEALSLSQAALAASGRRIGDIVEVSAAGHTARFVLTGMLPGVAEDQKIGVIDIAAAQWRFGRLGRLDRIDLRLQAGADAARVRAAVTAILPPDAELVSRQSQARRTDSLSRAYRVNLEMLALMALCTGGFLVYSAQALSVARRRSQFALLRVLGVERRALLAQVLLESAAVGVVGAVLGLGLGLGLAEAALRFLGGDLGGGYFSGAHPALALEPGAALTFLLLGLAASLMGGALPAREAARAQPAVALKNAGDAVDPRTAPKASIAFAFLFAGLLAALLPAIDGLPVFGYLSIALMLAGGVAAMPWIARRLLAPLQRLGVTAPAADLALKRLWGAPSQAAVALCGIVASTALMAAMAVMVSSFRGSVDDWLLQVLPADLYMGVQGGDRGGFDPATQHALATAPGVAAIHFRKTTPLRLSPDKPPVSLVAQSIDRAHAERSLPMIGAALPVPPGAIPVWMSEPAAWLYRRKAGDRITLPIGSATGDAATRVFVAGVWRDYARQYGAIAMADADYTRLSGDNLRSEASIDLAPGAKIATVTAALRAALPRSMTGRVSFTRPRELRIFALRLFDRSFAITYLLEIVAILVGLAGVAATVSAQTLARTKEFGMLRHIGVQRGQIMVMLALEGALLGAVGVVAGLGLGLMMSQVLIRVINPQSFHWTMQTRLPLGLFAAVTLALILASAATGLLAGRSALSVGAVRAVREDW